MSKSKNKKKTSQMVLRVEKHEKEQFLDICKELDTSAAREVRRFMREFVASNRPAPLVETEVSVVDAEPTPTVEEPVEAAVVEAEAPVSEEDAKPKKKSRKK